MGSKKKDKTSFNISNSIIIPAAIAILALFFIFQDELFFQLKKVFPDKAYESQAIDPNGLDKEVPINEIVSLYGAKVTTDEKYQSSVLIVEKLFQRKGLKIKFENIDLEEETNQEIKEKLTTSVVILPGNKPLLFNKRFFPFGRLENFSENKIDKCDLKYGYLLNNNTAISNSSELNGKEILTANNINITLYDFLAKSGVKFKKIKVIGKREERLELLKENKADASLEVVKMFESGKFKLGQHSYRNFKLLESEKLKMIALSDKSYPCVVMAGLNSWSRSKYVSFFKRFNAAVNSVSQLEKNALENLLGFNHFELLKRDIYEKLSESLVAKNKEDIDEKLISAEIEGTK